VNAVLWCIIVVSTHAFAQEPTHSIYSVLFDTVRIADVRATWSGPVVLTREPSTGKQVLGRFGSTSIALVLKQLPPHDFVHVSFDVAVIGSWDGVQDGDRLCVLVDGRDTVLYSSFSNTTYRQSYPDRFGAALHRQRTGARSQNSLGFTFVEPGVYNGRLDATYNVHAFVPHTADSTRIQLEGFLRDLRPGIDNESWALLSFYVECVSSPAKKLMRTPGIDTSFADDVFPGIIPTSDAVHALRIPLLIIECAPCNPGCEPVSFAVYTDGTAAAWKKRFHAREPNIAFELTSDEYKYIEQSVSNCLQDSSVRKHLVSVIERAGSEQGKHRDCSVVLGVGTEAFSCMLRETNPALLENLRQYLRNVFEQHGWNDGP